MPTGVYFNVRLEDTDNKRQCILVLMGATREGTKELIAITDGYRESEQSWRELLLDVRHHGLTIDPELAIGDGGLGFWGALRKVFPQTREQRCWVHKTANVLNKLPKGVQPKAKAMLHDIWMAETQAAADHAFDLFVATFAAKFPAATTCLVKDRDVLLTFYAFPAEHWIHIRTTNPVWCNKEAEARLVAGRSAAHGPCREPPPSPVSGGRRAGPLSYRQMRILSIGLVGWPRTDVWSAASGGAETSSQFRAGRRRAPFRPTSATITGERDRFRPLAPPVAVWAALCGGVAGVWPRRRDRALWAGGGRGGERVSSARGCASCPNVSPDGPSRAPLRGGASHEAEGRHGARRGGAGRVGPSATRRRLCVLRQIGDQLVAGLEQFLFVDDVVAVEDGAGLVAGQEHGDPLGDTGADQVAGGGAAAIVEEAGRHASRLTGGAPRRAPAADGDAVAVEDQRAVGVAACPPSRQGLGNRVVRSGESAPPRSSSARARAG